MRLSLPLMLVALLVAGCAKSGDEVADDGVGQVAGTLNSYWTYGKPTEVRTAEQIAADKESIDDAVFTSGIDNAVVEPLKWSGKTDDPGGALIDVLISVDTIKSGNGVLVRRNSAGSGTRCFHYVARHTATGQDSTYKEFRCPKAATS